MIAARPKQKHHNRWLNFLDEKKKVTFFQHSSDVKRLQILRSEGGITVDSDTFVVKKLNEYFDFDCTIGWPKNQNIGNQVSIL